MLPHPTRASESYSACIPTHMSCFKTTYHTHSNNKKAKTRKASNVRGHGFVKQTCLSFFIHSILAHAGTSVYW